MKKKILVCDDDKTLVAILTFLLKKEDVEVLPLPNGSRLLAVYHCGQRILNTHRRFEQQQRDWQRVAKALGRQHGAVTLTGD